MSHWVFTGLDVVCPVCGKQVGELDWVLDDEGNTTGARVFPCEDVVPMPPWQFGPSGASGDLKFTKVS